jgi:hypothetical protein
MKKQKSVTSKSHSFEKKDWLFLCLAVCVNVILNLFGFGWGMDGYVPWAPDAIEGITVVREMPKLYGEWSYKYPRLQFLIDGTCYQPLIEKWQREPAYITVNGQRQAQVLTQARLKTLATISRVNVLVMSALTVVFIYLSGRFYYSHRLAGFTAAVCTSLTYAFVFYSHTTCVDVPSMLWITAGFYFLLRSEALNTLRDHLAMAIMFAFACGTKDPMLFYAAAFAVVYAGLRFRRLYTDTQDWKKSAAALVNRNTLLAAGTFFFLFALLQNIIPSPGAYWERMGVWVGGRGVVDFNKGFTGQIPQLVITLKKFYWGMGWPFITAVLVSLIVTSRKHLVFNLLAVLFPLILFYVLVSMRIKMSYIRYYLPVMGLLYLPVGSMAAYLFEQRQRLWSRAALAAIGMCWVLSALYCAALDAEFIGDARNQTAAWFIQNVKKGTPVLSCIQRPYGPKLNQFGYQMIENWNVPPLEVLLAQQNQLPEYILVSSDWLNLQSPEAKALRKALLDHQTAYQTIATFTHHRLLNPKKKWISIACWPIPPENGMSPEIHVLKRH